jgi:hypothetical protein
MTVGNISEYCDEHGEIVSELPRYKRTLSPPRDLKWLHKIETIKCEIEGEAISYNVEDFGDYYDGDKGALMDIDAFLDSRGSKNLDIQHFLLNSSRAQRRGKMLTPKNAHD